MLPALHETILEHFANLHTVVSADPENLEVKLRMATVLEDMGRRAEALEMVSEGEYYHLAVASIADSN